VKFLTLYTFNRFLIVTFFPVFTPIISKKNFPAILIDSTVDRDVTADRADSEYNFVFVGLTECQRKRKDLETGPLLLGAYKPSCDEDGTYSPVQCHGSTGYCWCAFSDGTEWPGTKVRGQPDCTENKSKLNAVSLIYIWSDNLSVKSEASFVLTAQTKTI
jgi:hypothetical protein